jgi:hypothetical protein
MCKTLTRAADMSRTSVALMHGIVPSQVARVARKKRQFRRRIVI